jgi:hypothetical protein
VPGTVGIGTEREVSTSAAVPGTDIGADMLPHHNIVPGFVVGSPIALAASTRNPQLGTRNLFG